MAAGFMTHVPLLQALFPPGDASREAVAALLDGATPLHCAAIRGNPAQVDHLLLCGADPLLPNTAGERLGLVRVGCVSESVAVLSRMHAGAHAAVEGRWLQT